MKHGAGFTLVEVMIVVAVIAILAAIAVTSLVGARISANHESAAAGLSHYHSVNESVKTGGRIDGRNEYWTADLYGLHGLLNGSGAPMAALDESIAMADVSYPGVANYEGVDSLDFAEVHPIDGPTGEAEPASGYFYGVFAGNDPGPSGAYGTTNSARFGALSVPVAYGTSGLQAFAVNERGSVYAADAIEAADAGTGGVLTGLYAADQETFQETDGTGWPEIYWTELERSDVASPWSAY